MKKVALSFVMGLIAILALPNRVSAESSQGWLTITNNMKSDTTFQELKNGGYDVTVTSDDYQMVIQINGDEFTAPYIYTFTYANDIVYYNSTNTTNDTTYALVEGVIVSEFMQDVAEYYGYNKDEFVEWLGSVEPSTLTINDDGIEFSYYTIEQTSENVTSIKSLKVNVECGISSFHENTTTPEPEPTPVEPTPTPNPEPTEEEPIPDVEQTVENPNTGLYVSLGALAIAVIGAITFVGSRKKNYFSKI